MGGGELVRPAPPVADGWPVSKEAQHLGDARQASQTAWRDFFPDPRLQVLIERALENNRDLRIAVGRLQAARAEFGIASAGVLPGINASLSQSTQGRSAELAGAGNPLTARRTDLSLGVVSFELDLWNRLGSLSDSAKSTYLATEAARRGVRLSLISEVASTYFNLLELDERIEISQRGFDLRQQSLGLTDIAYTTGFVSIQDKLAAEGRVENARSDLAQLRRQRAVAQNKLGYLVGTSLDNVPEGRPLGGQDVENNLAPGLPAEVLLERPDVVEAEQRLRAAHANVGAARAAFLPKILLTAALGLASRSLTGLFGPGQGAWNFQPSMSLPLFDWGKTQGGVDAAEARKNIAVAEYERALQGSFREVADLLAIRESLLEQGRSADTQVGFNEQRLESVRAWQREGVASLLNVFDAEQEYLLARQGALQLRRQQLENAAALYKALGGGEALASGSDTLALR